MDSRVSEVNCVENVSRDGRAHIHDRAGRRESGDVQGGAGGQVCLGPRNCPLLIFQRVWPIGSEAAARLAVR